MLIESMCNVVHPLAVSYLWKDESYATQYGLKCFLVGWRNLVVFSIERASTF